MMFLMQVLKAEAEIIYVISAKSVCAEGVG